MLVTIGRDEKTELLSMLLAFTPDELQAVYAGSCLSVCVPPLPRIFVESGNFTDAQISNCRPTIFLSMALIENMLSSPEVFESIASLRLNCESIGIGVGGKHERVTIDVLCDDAKETDYTYILSPQSLIKHSNN